jgi:hypothetical protein
VISRWHVLAALLLAAPSAAPDTIYKYRRADGQVLYSSRPVAGVELIETFDYRFPAPVPASRNASKSDAEGEARITKYLAALDAAWREVQEAGKALAGAEERLRAGEEPQPGDRQGVVAESAPPTAGGVPTVAAPAIGGPMSGRRGRASPEYVARMQLLENEVQAARTRLEAALRNYNQLR